MKNEFLHQMETTLLNPFIKNPDKILQNQKRINEKDLPNILFISSYPPRECGIATYTQDLLKSIDKKYTDTFHLSVCALESGESKFQYPDEVEYVLDTNYPKGFKELAKVVNHNKKICLVLVQHEFGFFPLTSQSEFQNCLEEIQVPIVLVMHTVLPKPSESIMNQVITITNACQKIIVMTNTSSLVLQSMYGTEKEKIEVIAHGTHLVQHNNKAPLKEKYQLSNRTILSTFGLLSEGKGIETTLNSLPEIILKNPDVLFLIIGITHPSVILFEGEKYRDLLKQQVKSLGIEQHVSFINKYVPLAELLELLQLTDIYLFTSKDPYQAVSGTFSYAMSCGCPIISTRMPHAQEFLSETKEMLIDFNDSKQLSISVNNLLENSEEREQFVERNLQMMIPTAWENAAMKHADLFQQTTNSYLNQTHIERHPLYLLNPDLIKLTFRLPPINLNHLKQMTTYFGMLQFSKINKPQLDSGYTLDDNARALIAVCMDYEISGNGESLLMAQTYLNFIGYCQNEQGEFLNYVDIDHLFTPQNQSCNLEDAAGRAIWSLGFLISKHEILPNLLVQHAESLLNLTLKIIPKYHSTRSMAFCLKGLYMANQKNQNEERSNLIELLGMRLHKMYLHESGDNWNWFESYLTYANSVLPEAMLLAWKETQNQDFFITATDSLEFLIGKIFENNQLKVISNKTWLFKGGVSGVKGEQPIDVCYTILALNTFNSILASKKYYQLIQTSFSWFLGNNHLKQTIYNPCTGGCFDGLEQTHVNLNQGAESTLSYLISRFTLENKFNTNETITKTKKKVVMAHDM